MNVANTNGDTATATKAAGKDAGKDADKNGETDGASASTGQPQSSPNMQPVAAVIALNAPVTTAPPATNALAAIGGEAKPRPKTMALTAGDQDVTAQEGADEAADSSAATQATAADQTSSATSSGSTGAPTDATPLAAGAPQAQVQAETNAAVLAQTETAVQASSGHAGSRGDIGGATSGPGAGAAVTASGASGGANALPNFGFVTANASGTGAAASAAASNAAVPVAGLAVAIASHAQSGSNQFDIRLDPPELGRIDVRLGVDGNGQVTTHVTVERADTLQLLQSQQPQLERALEQAGLRTADNGLQFTLRDQSFAGQNGTGNGGGHQHAAQLVIPDADLPPVDTSQIYSRLSFRSGLDIRV
ncbi:MAG TPA: flagellar hook-length control protein FliK [Xanthobacteraceae bacterium]|nr:flagellar hook-length control protein FliK [Xanthobacteraceae bacterium]